MVRVGRRKRGGEARFCTVLGRIIIWTYYSSTLLFQDFGAQPPSALTSVTHTSFGELQRRSLSEVNVCQSLIGESSFGMVDFGYTS